MSRTPSLDQASVERLAHCTYTAFHEAFAPAMNVEAIYGIVVPTGSEFSQADADAMAPAPHIVSDAFTGTGAPPFPRLEFADGVEVVMVTVSGQTHDVLPVLSLPSTALGLVVAGEAMLAGVGRALGPNALIVTGCYATAATPAHTYAVAGIPDRNVYGALPSNHPDVHAVTSVVNRTCCRTS